MVPRRTVSPQTMSILLPHARPQHPRQMRGVLSQQYSLIVGEFVGNPAAACHASSLKQAAGFQKDWRLQPEEKRKGAEKASAPSRLHASDS